MLLLYLIHSVIYIAAQLQKRSFTRETLVSLLLLGSQKLGTSQRRCEGKDWRQI